MSDSKQAFGFGTPFAEQLAFLKQKLNLPTEHWDDIVRMAHDRSFIVAGVGKADLVNDFHRAINKAARLGLGMAEFAKDFKQIVFNHGWTGWTGEGTKAGEAWRIRVIYQTNMSTSYAAGRWQQLNHPDLLKIAPYWQYHHRDSVLHPRPLHLSWNGLTLPHDHVFWKTHFAPNGWGCHCYITAVNGKAFEAASAKGLGAPPVGWDKINPKTGVMVGIDKGFDYAPGANVLMSLRDMVSNKLITYLPAISKALSKDINRYVAANYIPSGFAAKVLADKTHKELLWLGFTQNATEIKQAIEVDLTGYPVLLSSDTVRHADNAHGFDGGNQRPITPADYDLVMATLLEYDEISLGNIVNGMQRFVVLKKIGDETVRLVFEVRQGEKNRTLNLVSIVVKK